MTASYWQDTFARNHLAISEVYVMSMILILEGVPADNVAKSLVSTSGESISENDPGGLRLFSGEIDESDQFDEFESLDEFDELADTDYGTDEFDDAFDAVLPVENSISLEKTWHGIHFLLTGDAWGGEGWRAFLVTGGQELGEDEGYGPTRVFTPVEVSEIAQGLSDIDGADLWAKFNAEELAIEEIYPDIWDEDEAELKEEYLEYFEQLKAFVAHVADNGEAMRVVMT